MLVCFAGIHAEAALHRVVGKDARLVTGFQLVIRDMLNDDGRLLFVD